MSQPVFLTVRVGDLSIGHSNCRIVDRNGRGSDYDGDFYIRLQKTPTDQNTHTDPVWNQRYTVDPLGDEDINEKIESWSDLGELILAPGEKPQESSDQYCPGTRLCPPQSFLLRPKLDEQILVILPTGRPHPIHLQPVGALIFNAKVSVFHKKSFFSEYKIWLTKSLLKAKLEARVHRNLLVHLRIGIRDSTWPVLGSVNDDDKHSNLNPFYCQERIAFQFSSPKLELKPFADSQSPAFQTRNSSSSTTQSQISAIPSRGNSTIRPPLPPSAQRSISVVEFAPPSPGMLAAAAPALNKPIVAENASQNHKEVGHSFFFSKDEESVPTESGDKESPVEPTAEDPIQCLESPDFEGIVSYNRPLTVAWSVEQSHFNKNLRPSPKTDGVGVIANFSFLVGSKYDRIKPRMHYTCNFMESYGKSTQQNGFGGLFSRSGQKNK
nr:hypothetical transcript [Hymenolepis microstoma]